MAAIVVAATRAVAAATTLRLGLVLTPPGLALMVAAEATGSIALLVAGTIACGAAAALSYRGALARVNEIAPGEQRAEVVSAYFVCCFLGNALPVIGVGALAEGHGLPLAIEVFAVVLAVLALAALGLSVRGAKR